jgi:hypothetical protein
VFTALKNIPEVIVVLNRDRFFGVTVPRGSKVVGLKGLTPAGEQFSDLHGFANANPWESEELMWLLVLLKLYGRQRPLIPGLPGSSIPLPPLMG